MTLLTNTKFGSLLVAQNLITNEQRLEILDYQLDCAKPFGVLAEKLFNVDPEAIERVWLMQYMAIAPRVDLTQTNIDKRYLGLVNKRQAWQFGVLPISFDDGCLMIATTKQKLARAHRFASRFIDLPFVFVIAEEADLDASLCQSYQGKAMRYDHHMTAVSNREAKAEVHVLVKSTVQSHQHQLVG